MGNVRVLGIVLLFSQSCMSSVLIKRDPFYLPSEVRIETEDKKHTREASPVTGIITVGGRRGALIRTHVVYEGDTVDGYTIVRIGQRDVEVENDKKEKITWFIGYL